MIFIPNLLHLEVWRCLPCKLNLESKSPSSPLIKFLEFKTLSSPRTAPLPSVICTGVTDWNCANNSTEDTQEGIETCTLSLNFVGSGSMQGVTDIRPCCTGEGGWLGNAFANERSLSKSQRIGFPLSRYWARSLPTVTLLASLDFHQELIWPIDDSEKDNGKNAKGSVSASPRLHSPSNDIASPSLLGFQ